MISFIIPAYNEEKVIGRTLSAIHDAARSLHADYEVVVADDASTDATARVAEQHGARVVAVNRRQIAATRNAGARAANGDLFVFVDADTLVNQPVVQAAVAALESGAVGGGGAFRFDGHIPLAARLPLAVFARLYRWAGLAPGCFLFCTRAAFDAVGGFDEQIFAGEEVALVRALRRHGRFVLLRETVSTSGRKLRTHSGFELIAATIRLLPKLYKLPRNRDGLDIWYGPRRHDPDLESEEPGASTGSVRISDA